MPVGNTVRRNTTAPQQAIAHPAPWLTHTLNNSYVAVTEMEKNVKRESPYKKNSGGLENHDLFSYCNDI